MRLYKNSDNQYTLVTHDSRLYSLAIQGIRHNNPYVISQYLGKLAPGAIVTGVKVRRIPNFLKTKCFTLNKKP